MSLKTSSSSTPIDHLIQLVEELRDPSQGCPWDINQTHSSLIPYVIEESHEVVDAIRNGSDKNLLEELGDLLLQIILHTQIAKEKNKFDFNDVVVEISNKIIRRHPHVFDKKSTLKIEDVEKIWEQMKKKENPSNQSKLPISDGIRKKIRSQPALAGAMYISRKVAKEGFEWKNIDGVMSKVEEELLELKEALKNQNINHAKSELGDVLFSLVNIARWCKLDPDESLAETNQRFLDRFAIVEKSLNGKIGGQSLSTLKIYWERAKKTMANNKRK